MSKSKILQHLREACLRSSLSCYLFTVCAVSKYKAELFDLCDKTSACQRFSSECDTKTGRCPNDKCDPGFGGRSCNISK